jgi:catechol 2,3-dioxygenase-like lactoylglutathione lyase family enzyme
MTSLRRKKEHMVRPNSVRTTDTTLEAQMTRRDFGLLLGAAAAAFSPSLGAQTPGRPVIKAETFNHLAMGVTEVKRTADWYQKVFGMSVRFGQDASGARVAILQIADGPEFLELVPLASGAKPGFLHMGFGVQNFNRTSIDEALSARDMKGEWRVRKAPGGDVEEVVIRDPDNLQIQIQDVRYTAGAGRLGDTWPEPWAKPPQNAQTPVRVRCINHATFGSVNKTRIENFYADLFGMKQISWDYRPAEPSKIFGFAAAESPRSFVAPGQGSVGISHYCLGVESFDQAKVIRMLTDLGTTVPPPQTAPRKACCGAGIMYQPTDTVFVSDPDGIRVQLTDMNYCAGTGPLGVEPALSAQGSAQR